MPWVCNVCTLKNSDDASTVCDLCGSAKGTPDPDAHADPKTRESNKRMSLTALLRAGPDEFAAELQEKRRLDALKSVKGVFGVPLKQSAPRVMCDCMAFILAHGMDVEGIFRVPGQQDTVDALRAAFEKDEARNVLAEIRCEPHDVGTLFKTFFRAMPEPLLPVSHYDALMDSMRAEHATKEELVRAVNDVIKTVPNPQRECFGLVINFLKKVALYQEQNKMTPANLATCFAPSLLRAPDDASAQQALMDMSAAIGALNVLIREPDELAQPSPDEIARNTKYRATSARPNVAPPPGMAAFGAPPPGMGSAPSIPPPPPPPPGF